MSLNNMNNRMKIFINEATGISSRCKLKLIKLVQKHFMVELPNDNFLNIDIEILENGNIKMRDIEYQTSNHIQNKKELEERFESFKKDAELLIAKNEINLETISSRKERSNLVWVVFISFAIVVISLYSIKRLFMGDLYGVLWLVIMIGYYIIPATGNNIRNRYVRVFHYLKSLIYKKKKK